MKGYHSTFPLCQKRRKKFRFAKTKLYIEDFAEDLRSILEASLNLKTGLSALNESSWKSRKPHR